MPAFTMQSPIGLLTIEETDGAITALRFGGETVSPPPTPLLQRAAQQLTEYFAARRRTFALPLRPQGTAFQQAAWSALCDIPSARRAPTPSKPPPLAIPKPAAPWAWPIIAIPSPFSSPATVSSAQAAS